MKELLVVRHAIAEDAADYARNHPDDAGRPLVFHGEQVVPSRIIPTIDVAVREFFE